MGPSDTCLVDCCHAEAEEEEGESEKEEEEDIFALEGETEHLHLSTPGQPQELPNQERIQGRGGWEGAARGAHRRFPHQASCHDTLLESSICIFCVMIPSDLPSRTLKAWIFLVLPSAGLEHGC